MHQHAAVNFLAKLEQALVAPGLAPGHARDRAHRAVPAPAPRPSATAANRASRPCPSGSATATRPPSPRAAVLCLTSTVSPRALRRRPSARLASSRRPAPAATAAAPPPLVASGVRAPLRPHRPPAPPLWPPRRVPLHLRHPKCDACAHLCCISVGLLLVLWSSCLSHPLRPTLLPTAAAASKLRSLSITSFAVLLFDPR